MTTGETIQLKRKIKGLSQEQLANEIGVTRQAVSKWEMDQTLPDTDKLILISKILECSIDELLNNEKEVVKEVSSSQHPTSEVDKILKIVRTKWYYYGLVIMGSGAFLGIGSLLMQGFWKSTTSSMGFGSNSMECELFGQCPPDIGSNLFSIPMILGLLIFLVGLDIFIYGKSKDTK